jgi:hypothetical protein
MIAAVQSASSPSDLSQLLAALPSTRTEYKDATLNHLFFLVMDQWHFMRFSLSDNQTEQVRRFIERYTLDNTDLYYLNLVSGYPVPLVSDEMLVQMKATASKLTPAFEEINLAIRTVAVVPACSVGDAFFTLLTGDGPVLEVKERSEGDQPPIIFPLFIEKPPLKVDQKQIKSKNTKTKKQ